MVNGPMTSPGEPFASGPRVGLLPQCQQIQLGRVTAGKSTFLNIQKGPITSQPSHIRQLIDVFDISRTDDWNIISFVGLCSESPTAPTEGGGTYDSGKAEIPTAQRDFQISAGVKC